ncbi:MAG TPA: pyridoxal phosphate-dependent aminotransferase, partial [Thermoanaerobaculia bacterium]|nr:pyridoxal phosphate-dependent aminotransferase [Thermoanaerobaculia bacterium]
RFAEVTHAYMGDPGTHPWAQGFPLTTRLPGGPPLPTSVGIGAADLKYPSATGQHELRQAIADMYDEHYGTRLSEENVALFAGGRPGIFATLALLLDGVTIAVEETEYTPYFDMLRLLGREPVLVASNEANRFRPAAAEYEAALEGVPRAFLLKSNPCNPTGVAVSGTELRALVELFRAGGRGALFDEAYELFNEPAPDSALRYIGDIDETDLFVVGAATKGFQAPGIRLGWVIAARRHVELFRNLSSIAMGGVSRLSQLYALELLEPARVRSVREAVPAFFSSQRARYAKGLRDLGLELFTGTGGFYHWAKLPGGLRALELNERLFAHKAAILPGRLCDMARREGAPSPLDGFIRFSFGPLSPESYDEDMEILRACL